MIPAARRRLIVLYAVVIALLVTLGGRLWLVQVMDGSSYVNLAAQDQTRDVVVPPTRGQILDDTGVPLVTDTTSLVISVNMATLARRPHGGASVLRRLARLLGRSYRTLAQQVRLCGTTVTRTVRGRRTTQVVTQPCWNGSPYQPIPVERNAPATIALQIMEQPRKFPGVTARPQGVVTYPQPDGADPAQVLGYTQPVTAAQLTRYEKKYHLTPGSLTSSDLLAGQAGLEEEYNSALAGTPGTKVVSVNAAGQVTGTVRSTPPKPGDTLITSLNATLQADVQRALAAGITRGQSLGKGTTTGAAVVMTTTGRVLAMASYPTYDPNVWTNGLTGQEYTRLFGAADHQPALNRATQDQQPPGSTWKLTTAAAAAMDGYSVHSLYNCPATITVDGQSFADDGEPNLGMMTLRHALAISCDTVFYELALGMYDHGNLYADTHPGPHAPTQKMQRMELDFGFGAAPGIDLPAAEQAAGTVPTRRFLYNYWKANAHTGADWCKYGKANGSELQKIEYDDCVLGDQWTPGQAVMAAIGQGYVTATPLQIADAYAALTNGGTLYAPRIGEALVSPSGKVVKRINPPVIRHVPVAASVLTYIKNALASTPVYGTAAPVFAGFPLNKVCVAGKTGTAQVVGQHSTSWFVSYAPCSHPRFVTVVMYPRAGYGEDDAAPTAKQIWDDIYGLQGARAVFPGGRVPTTLPEVSATGRITPPHGYTGGS